MLVRQKLDNLKCLVLEYNLRVSVLLVMLYSNLDDQLTRMSHKWYVVVKMGAEPGGKICTATASAMSQQQIN